jgi:hypothetical protein
VRKLFIAPRPNAVGGIAAQASTTTARKGVAERSPSAAAPAAVTCQKNLKVPVVKKYKAIDAAAATAMAAQFQSSPPPSLPHAPSTPETSERVLAVPNLLDKTTTR